MVKIVLIGKKPAAPRPNGRCRARFVGTAFILHERRTVMVNRALRALYELHLKSAQIRTAVGDWTMAVQRKVFRIEESAEMRVASSARDAEVSLRHHEFMAEIRALRSLIQPNAPASRETLERSRAQIAEAQAYKAELDLIHAALRRTREEAGSLEARASRSPDIARASGELEAIVAGTEQATQQVLQAAEDIDQTASALMAVLKGSYEKGLANDIRDRVVQVFEACNFQDLTGQRVGKVVEILASLEEHVGRLAEIWSRLESFEPAVLADGSDGDDRFLNGPRLNGDAGHSSQSEIDGLFD
jgi:chemotaxis protein CheZ